MTLTVSHRIVSLTLRNDEGFTLSQLHGPLVKLDTQVSFEYEKELVFIFVAVPCELAVHLGYLYVYVIDLRNDAR
jgi:hypothetical protein